MNLKQIAARLDSTRIENLEVIAQKISASDQQEYSARFAREISRQKLQHSNMPFQAASGDFPFTINLDVGIYVGVSPGTILLQMGKSSLVRYSKQLASYLPKGAGIVQFLPFQMNGRNVRSILEKELDVAFVNLPYDAGSLRRRFLEYGLLPQ
jgi:hypothetical protein